MDKQTLPKLQKLKLEGKKFAAITCYDSSFAGLIETAGIECILVGDSLGNVIQGHDSTLPVTMEAMVYHTECVARGNSLSYRMSDMPYMSFNNTEQALHNAARLTQAGAHIVKLEAGRWLLDTVSQMSQRGLAVCAHLGLLPQSINKLGSYRQQGVKALESKTILEEAMLLEEAGADMLLLECIPSKLGQQITSKVTIPVIGIGAGPSTDAQVLVLYDILGLNPNPPSFTANFMESASSIAAALKEYAKAVQEGRFPKI